MRLPQRSMASGGAAGGADHLEGLVEHALNVTVGSVVASKMAMTSVRPHMRGLPLDRGVPGPLAVRSRVCCGQSC